jgi:NADH-quinone oxidoreductase subunit M
MYQRVVFGEVRHEENRGLKDLSIREVAILAPIVAGMLWIGVYPNALLNKSAASVNGVLSRIHTERTMAAREMVKEGVATDLTFQKVQNEK